MKMRNKGNGSTRRAFARLAFAAGLSCLLLGGCASKEKKVVQKHIKLENGKIQDSSYVVRVGGEGVRYSEIRGYCYLLRKQYDASFGGELWDYSLGENLTIGEEAKEEILNMVTQLRVIEAQAKVEKIELTADERDEAVRQAEKILNSATAEEKKEFGLTEQTLIEIFESNYLANKMFYIATDDADTEVSDEEARQAQIQYIFLRTGGTDADGKEITLDKDEKKAAEKRANKILKEARKTERFSDLAQKYSADTRTELIMGGNETSIAEEAVASAMALHTGEVSMLVEASDGYYILYCVNEKDADATYQKKEEIIAERQERMFKKKYANWLGENEIEISKSFWKIFHV